MNYKEKKLVRQIKQLSHYDNRQYQRAIEQGEPDKASEILRRGLRRAAERQAKESA